MPDPTILDRLMIHLAGEGIARKPGDAGAGARPWPPPFWRSPEEGSIGPGDKGRNAEGAILAGAPGNEADDGLVLTAKKTGEIAPAPGEGYAQRDIVDLWIRSRRVPSIYDIAKAIALELAPRPYGVAYELNMGGLLLIESRQWRPLQLLEQSAQGHTYIVAYLFEYHR